MSLRKLFSAVSLWSISTRRSSDVSVFSDIRDDPWPLGNSSSSAPCTSTPNAWPARGDSFPRHRMTPSPEIVLKQGFLYKKRERSSAASLKRPWQSGYFVLKKSTGYSGLLLDEYRDASLRVAKQTLFLDTVKHVGPVNTSRSKRYAFQVVVLGRSPLFFACDNEFLRSEWISVFGKYTDESADLPSHGRISPEGGPSASARQSRPPQTNSVYVDMKGEESNGRLSISDYKGYEVTIQKTPLSEANNLQGSFLLRITKLRIYLKQFDRKDDVLSWPLTQLRGFKSQPNQQQIILETGRRCHFGKGRLIFRTKYGESIINDIRGAISTDSLSSGNSSDSETEQVHPPVTRSLSEQKCNVTVSVRPRRMHSERVINQVAVGRSPNGKASGKTSPIGPNAISPNFLLNTTNNCLRPPNSTTDTSTEDVFTFDDKLGLFKDTTKNENTQKTVNWKTSTTFSKTMIDSKSDNENEASSNDCEDDTEFHPYIDIIPDEEAEKPLGSDEASTLLAQVVADLTEPQKQRNCFIKSKSTGGITVRPVDLINEIRRASEPAVGSRDYIASPTSENDAQGSPLNTHWTLRLERINEVSFTEATESDRQNDQHLSPKTSPGCDCMPAVENDRPRSLSELVANELEMPTLVKSTKKRSKTLLGITHSHVGSSLTDLSNTTPLKHKGLRSTLSHSASSAFSHQLAKDPSSIGFAQGMGRIPSFPKSRVVKSVDNSRVLENTRTKMNINSLPPEFHATPPNESFENDLEKPEISSPVSPTFTEPLPPRPPKDRPIETRNWKKNSLAMTQSSPPPLPVRSPSLPTNSTHIQQSISPSHFNISPPQPIISPREKATRFNSSFETTTKPYANTPPKVQPRIPNAMPLQSTNCDDSNESINPPPRPPKPDSISVALRQSTMDQFVPSPGSLRRRALSEKRADGYPWEANGLRGEGSPQLERMKSPIVMITPPRSPTLGRPPKGLLRGISLSDSDITDALERKLQFKTTPGTTQNTLSS